MYYLARGASEADALAAFAYRNALKKAFNLGMTGPIADEAYMAGRYGSDFAAWIKAAGRTATGAENALFGVRGYWNYLGAYLYGAGMYGLYSEDCP